ncbi:MAG: LysR family transcriptional regulator [Pseudomonadota bacterium]
MALDVDDRKATIIDSILFVKQNILDILIGIADKLSMKLDVIHTFLVVAKLGSLSKAAERLNVTQSTVSGRLDTLDQAMNQKLLNRAKKGARLTPAGEDFRKHAELITRSWAAARAKAQLPNDCVRTFNLGCETDLWTGLVDAFLFQARHQIDETAFLVNTSDSDGLLASLESNLLDAILLSTAPTLSGYRICHVFNDELVQVSTQSRSSVDWDTSYVRVNYGKKFETQHLHHWPEDRTAHVTFNNPEWALCFILENGGSAYLPLRLVKPCIETGQLSIVEGAPEFKREIYAIWHPLCEDRHHWLKSLIDRGFWEGTHAFE